MNKATHIGSIDNVLHRIEWDGKSRMARTAWDGGDRGSWMGPYSRDVLEKIGWVLKPIKPKCMVNK